MSEYRSWGNYPKAEHRNIEIPYWASDIKFPAIGSSVLAHGLGRSYGDSCLNNNNELIITSQLNRILAFDTQSGVIRCEAGLSLRELISVVLPQNWFLSVTPGTTFVTVGGAIANDVHGKNHHCAGTFGCHVLSFTLLRSDGSIVSCSPKENSELFAATIGGLGLTGLILEAELQLRSVPGPYIDAVYTQFGSLDEFFELSKSSSEAYEYTVAWLDTTYHGPGGGRGIFMQGNHSEQTIPALDVKKMDRGLRVPFNAPNWALNSWSVRAFNEAYYRRLLHKTTEKTELLFPFFYPLDAMSDWNRIYGSRGFLQFQCIVPQDNNHSAIRELISIITKSRRASFLAVLKECGSIESPGLLSFPRPGTTVALDFPFDGTPTLELFSHLEDITRQCGGALYPAKDACMTSETFRSSYSSLDAFVKHIDPAFSSSFWRRVTQ